MYTRYAAMLPGVCCSTYRNRIDRNIHIVDTNISYLQLDGHRKRDGFQWEFCAKEN